MPLPNLLIVGAQKSGTTWLHKALMRSARFGANGRFKELNFLLLPDFEDRLEEYANAFPDDPAHVYRFESTPGYFSLPDAGIDVAARVARHLPGIETLAVLRNPMDRYLSAYTHHMMRRRLPHTAEITDLDPSFNMLAYGMYGAILTHWRQHVPGLRVYFYDDLVANQPAFLAGVMADLGLDCDVPPRKARFRANDKEAMFKRLGWDSMPVLSDALRDKLKDYYRADIAVLQDQTGRDLAHWLA